MNKIIQVVNSSGVPFNVKLVKTGEELHSRDGGYYHDKNDYIIEFYDARYTEKFGELGQYVSSYYESTLEEHRGGLDLYGGVDSWYVTYENMQEIKKELIFQ